MTMTNQTQQPTEIAFTLDNGETVVLEAGAVWDYDEAGGATTIQLSDCNDRRLIGIIVSLDWSQLMDAPDTVEARLEAVFREDTAMREAITAKLEH